MAGRGLSEPVTLGSVEGPKLMSEIKGSARQRDGAKPMGKITGLHNRNPVRLARVVNHPRPGSPGACRYRVSHGERNPLPAGHYVEVDSHGCIVAHIYALEFDSDG